MNWGVTYPVCLSDFLRGMANLALMVGKLMVLPMKSMAAATYKSIIKEGKLDKGSNNRMKTEIAHKPQQAENRKQFCGQAGGTWQR